jgi:hypothetical protein
VEAVLPVCSRYGLAVAGGYAVKAHGLVERPSEDRNRDILHTADRLRMAS